MGLFRKLPEEIKEAYKLLDESKEVLLGVDESLLQQTINEARKALTIDRAEMNAFIKGIKENNLNLKEWVYTYIINDAADKMESGHYHVYRGLLDFTGRAYKKIFERSIRVMIEMGAYSKEWADKNIREPVYSNIEKVG